MKIGMIFECSNEGPDMEAYPYVARTLCPVMDVDKVALGDKKVVFEEGPDYVQAFLQTGCQRVYIVWDRKPAWNGLRKVEDEEKLLLENLKNSGIDLNKVELCCIVEEMESWLVEDEKAVTAYFQTFTNKTIPKFKPTTGQHAFNKISSYNGKYNSFKDNFGIVQKMPAHFKPAQKNKSFKNFCQAILNDCAKAQPIKKSSK